LNGVCFSFAELNNIKGLENAKGLAFCGYGQTYVNKKQKKIIEKMRKGNNYLIEGSKY